ncbi:MAG: cell wall-binding repeat-containing protein, partial [Buchananella hordeovulneris]|nr:cell wall-binding repeat-containing protein [Buchananella hordeovulneris]
TPTPQPTVTMTPTPQPVDKSVVRVGGADRYSTAIKALEAGKFDGKTVVLVSGETFADALAAGSLAGTLDAPLVLTRKNTLPAEVRNALVKADTRDVYLVGGNSSVSKRVVDQLQDEGIRVTRIAGVNRFDTATQVARKVKASLASAGHDVAAALVADGMEFADSLAAGVTAGSTRSVVLLTQGAKLPAETKSYLQNDAAAVMTYGVGGKAVQALKKGGINATAVVGVNRYDTASKLATTLHPNATRILLVTGTSPWDALSAGGLGGKLDAVLALTSPNKLPEQTAKLIRDKQVGVTILGLHGSVSAAVENQVKALLK